MSYKSERDSEWYANHSLVHFAYSRSSPPSVAIRSLPKLPLAQYTHNSWPSATTKKTPYELILGYTPRVHQPQRTIDVPGTKDRLEWIQEARCAAQAAITHAQSLYKDSPRFQPYQEGDKVWLDARNLKTTHA